MTDVKMITTSEPDRLQITESVLHIVGKRKKVAKNVWLFVGGVDQVGEEYFEKDNFKLYGYHKFLIIPRNDITLIAVIEEVGLEQAQAGRSKLMIVDI